MQRDKEIYDRVWERPDGKAEVFHYTTCEAAESIRVQELFYVSRNSMSDATFGCGVYASYLSGETNTASDMAACNYGEVTEESLRKSQCYFKITVDAKRVHGGRTSDRFVLIIQPSSSSATELRFSELGQVEGPFFTKGVPEMEQQAALACWAAKKVARGRARTCAAFPTFRSLQELTACILWPFLLCGLIVAVLCYILFGIRPEPPDNMLGSEYAAACVETFSLPPEMACDAPEISEARDRPLRYAAWFVPYLGLSAFGLAGFGLGAAAVYIVAIVEEKVAKDPCDAMLARLQGEAESIYRETLSHPYAAARLRLDMDTAELESLLEETRELRELEETRDKQLRELFTEAGEKCSLSSVNNALSKELEGVSLEDLERLLKRLAK